MASNAPTSFAHMVFFTLKDSSAVAQDELVRACHKYLADHSGTTYFSAGCRAKSCQRPVNDIEFHVALILAFDGEADHDRYQESERHQKFIGENQDNWAQVQVFDALV